MNTTLRANIRTNLRFYARNRLLLILSLLFGGIMSLSLLPSLFFTSAGTRFHILLQIYSAFRTFLFIVVGMIALLSVWYHRSQKCVKLVFTKPCSPENWILS